MPICSIKLPTYIQQIKMRARMFCKRFSLNCCIKAPLLRTANIKKAWLIKTTTNQCKDFLKSSRRKNLPLNDEILGEEIFDDKKLDVRNKLLKLDSKYKTVLYLFYYEDYTVEMIANTLSLSKSNVKMRLKRGRELLKNELEEYSNER